MTFIKTYLAKIIVGGICLIILAIIIYALYAAFSMDSVGQYIIDHMYLVVTNILITGYLVYQFFTADTITKLIQKISKIK